MSDDMHVVAYELSNSDGETIIIRSERHQVESYKHKYPTDLVNELVRKPDALTLLAARDAEIARDSARLDWLEKNCGNVKSQWDERQCVVEWQVTYGEWHPSLRAAIDAARETE